MALRGTGRAGHRGGRNNRDKHPVVGELLTHCDRVAGPDTGTRACGTATATTATPGGGTATGGTRSAGTPPRGNPNV